MSTKITLKKVFYGKIWGELIAMRSTVSSEIMTFSTSVWSSLPVFPTMFSIRHFASRVTRFGEPWSKTF